MDLRRAARLDHDLIAARHHGILDALTSADVLTFADRGYQSAGGSNSSRSTANQVEKSARMYPCCGRQSRTAGHVNIAHASRHHAHDYDRVLDLYGL